MIPIEAKPEALELFRDVCEAVNVPRGAARLDAFLALPEPQQERIWRELGHLLEADRRHSGEGQHDEGRAKRTSARCSRASRCCTS